MVSGEERNLLLTADEAVDLARFRGYFVPDGMATVPAAREVLVAELTPKDIAAFLDHVGAPPPGFWTEPRSTTTGTFFVVVRGKVVNRMGGAAPSLGDSLALAIDRSGRALYVGVGPPWYTLAPPSAVAAPIRDGPKLTGVSRARAEQETGGGPLVEPASLPAGLQLRRIDINPVGSAPGPCSLGVSLVSVTFIYAERAGTPRLWPTQASFTAEPHLSDAATPVPIAGADRKLHVGPGCLALTWRRGDRRIVLSTTPQAGLDYAALLDIAASIAVDRPTPSLPPTATPR